MAGCGESEIRRADVPGSHLQVGLALAFRPRYLCPQRKTYLPSFPGLLDIVQCPETLSSSPWVIPGRDGPTHGQLSYLMSHWPAGTYFLAVSSCSL